ncbi:MAG TPA: carbonic anhydrase family protein [Steroidobacteraceae bacterium]|nr:carbonic anhydrase family protein [Steroidobacteraceae bacterium]
MRRILLWALSAAACCTAVCGTAAHAQEEGPSWSYAGETGPSHWASEDLSYRVCGTGRYQSPIDIKNATPKALSPIAFDYQPIPLTVTDTGHTMQVSAPPGSGGITVGEERYELVQFHFHRPSEESINGKRFQMEVHLVHKNARGELAVVSVLLRGGNSNPVLREVFDNLPPSGQKEASVPGVTLDPTQLLPKVRGYYTFEGSLTTPPCSEHVRWFVLRRAMQASSGEIVLFAARYPNNARPTQPRAGRPVEQTQD